MSVGSCIICLFLVVGLSFWIDCRADAAAEIVVPSIKQGQTDIEFIIPIRIATPPRSVATLVRTSPPHEPSSDQSHVPWDFYLDNTWSILGGDVAQTLANAVQDLQGHSGARLSIEAYCDDRDTSTYSLVIGDQWLSKVEYTSSASALPRRLSRP